MAFRSKKKDKKGYEKDLKKKGMAPKISAPTAIPPHLLKTKSRFDTYSASASANPNSTILNVVPTSVPAPSKPRLNLQVEPEPFLVDNFNDDEYLQSLGALEDKGIKSFHQNLQDAYLKSTQKIQKHVYRHYHEFVTISKEITKLETDIIELHDILADLQTVGEVFLGKGDNYDGQDGEESKSKESANSHSLSSKTDLNSNTYVDQIVSNEEENKLKLSKIWKAVQGSEDYLPHVPFRCPIMESPGWKELDPTNFRPKRDAHFFLLTDSFLVAVRAKRQTMLDITQATKASLIARSCWSLKEIHVADVKDNTNGVENAFKISRKNETFIYMAMNKEEKRRFLKALARANNEYVNRQKRQAMQKNSVDSITSSVHNLDISDSNQDAELEQLIVRASSLDSDFWNNLDVSINHHKYKEATESIMQATSIIDSLPDRQFFKQELQNLLNYRIIQLCNILTNNILNCPHSSKKILLNNVKLLIKLGLIEQAQKVFFESRKNIIRIRIRQLKLDGNTLNFVRELSKTVFLLILNTCKWYTPNFTNLSMGSALINWVRSELENFCQLFRNQVFDNNIEFSVIELCLREANKECRKLREVGMDLNFVLDQLFLPDITRLATDSRYQGIKK